MFENKLIALDFYAPSLEYQDETKFRNFISWLENQKLRLYKIEDRTDIDNVDSELWTKAFEKYLNDAQIDGLTIETDRELQIEKLLALAIRYEYSDNLDKYNVTEMQIDAVNDESNPLTNLDFNSEEFKQGLYQILRVLNVPVKLDDNTSCLQAVAKLISEKFNQTAINTALSTKPAENLSTLQLELDNINLGFDSEDKVLNNAAKIMRLLHIRELRDLQTKINETIVSIQNVTANPKTDSSLGRVGR